MLATETGEAEWEGGEGPEEGRGLARGSVSA